MCKYDICLLYEDVLNLFHIFLIIYIYIFFCLFCIKLLTFLVGSSHEASSRLLSYTWL